MNKLIVFACHLAVSYGFVVTTTVHRSDERIVGGTDTDISEVPYQVALEWNGLQFCGGSIISDTYIVTTANCVDGLLPYQITIRTGSSVFQQGGTSILAKNYFINPGYNSDTRSHNVAVLELAEPISLNSSSAIVALAEDEPQGGDQVKVSGWGTLTEEGDKPSNLQSVVVPVVDRTACEKVYEGIFVVDTTMICAGVEGKDSCNGDTGGPLVLDGKLVGIVARGLGCARQDYPGVYTNVAYKEVREFILSIIKP